MNNPNNKTENRNKKVNQKSLFLANFKLMKNIATLFINEVFDNAYVHTNVNNKNINVEFPKLDEKTLEKEKFSKKPNENMQRRLGQSIPIVSHKIKDT